MVSSIYINITVCSYKLCLLATNWKAKILSFIPSFIEMWWISNMIILYAYYLEITFNWSASGFCLEKRPAALPQEISEVSQHTVVQSTGEADLWESRWTGQCSTPVRSIFLETLFDCSQFQNTQEEDSQSQTMDTENVSLSR